MKYLVSVNTNKGNVKKINQDSALILEGEGNNKKILLASICDGMGGLSKGEVASGKMVERTREWFLNEFPPILFRRKDSLDFMAIQNSLNRLVTNVNRELAMMAEDDSQMCGTTCVLFITDGKEYMTMNVGDSRAYKINSRIKQLTKDQTYVQREIDAGNMTESEAKTNPNRNMLLQCIGASEIVTPEYTIGDIESDDGFMLCSDGFRHKIGQNEFLALIDFHEMKDENDMNRVGEECIRINMNRNERDNITVILIHPIRELE